MVTAVSADPSCALPTRAAAISSSVAAAARLATSWQQPRSPGFCRSRSRRQSPAQERRWPSPALVISLALAPTLMLLAAMAAPEQPRSLEAICQRHHGVEACRVL